MREEFLKIGDVIRLGKGMQIGVAVPKRFCVPSFSDELYTTHLQIGTVLHGKTPDKNVLIGKTTQLLRTLLDEKVNESKVSAFLDTLSLEFAPDSFDTSVFEGVYRVYEQFFVESNRVSMWCEKLDAPEVRVFFYQTKTVAGVQPDIEPINVE